MNEIIRNTQSSVTHTSLDPQDWSEISRARPSHA
ncbi:hypothetical protein ACVWWO_001796 [Bradyrhizobium sp. F1.13.1]